MSGPLDSGLDGPKWAPVDGHRRLRSQSQLIPEAAVSVAPKKPRVPEPSVASQASLAGSSKKLFPSSPVFSSGESRVSAAESPDLSDTDDTPCCYHSTWI